MKAKYYRFTAKDIAHCLQWDRREVYRAIERGLFDPNDLWSLSWFIGEEQRRRDEDRKAGPDIR